MVCFYGSARTPAVQGGPDTPRDVLGSPYAYCRETDHLDAHDPVLVLGHRRLSIIDLSSTGHQPMARVVYLSFCKFRPAVPAGR
jgi:hypothetical protein